MRPALRLSGCSQLLTATVSIKYHQQSAGGDSSAHAAVGCCVRLKRTWTPRTPPAAAQHRSLPLIPPAPSLPPYPVLLLTVPSLGLVPAWRAWMLDRGSRLHYCLFTCSAAYYVLSYRPARPMPLPDERQPRGPVDCHSYTSITMSGNAKSMSCTPSAPSSYLLCSVRNGLGLLHQCVSCCVSSTSSHISSWMYGDRASASLARCAGHPRCSLGDG